MGATNYANWQEDFKEKEIKPKYLAKIISPGTCVYIGSGCSEPTLLTSQLANPDLQGQFRDCQLLHYFSLSNQKFFDEQSPTRIRHNTLSIIGSAQLRDAVNSGKADYTPIRSAEIPVLLENRRFTIDVALIQVSPPDSNGWCSLGINVDINRAIINVAKKVVAHINPKMPRTLGDSFIRFSRIDQFIFEDYPVMEYQSPQPDERTEKIAQYVARLIDNGSTLNLGIGKIPYALPKYLNDKKDLAIFSEVILDSLIPLIDNGVITCAHNYLPHCMASFALGSAKSYSYYANNAFIEFQPTEFMTNIQNIAKNNKMCSVYTAVSVDLIGQVTNDSRSMLYSGIGGEADFMRGTALSKGGRCIITLPSITDEERSRIIPMLTTEPVAVNCYDVHYVVTEYGIAHLHGKSLRERIMQMIGVAHPKYRQWLLEAAQKYQFVYPDQKIPQTHEGVVVIYPEIEWGYSTKSNEEVIIRAVRPTDERLIQELYYSLSDHDRIMRFFRPYKFFSHEETQRQIICDYSRSMVLVALTGQEDSGQKIIAVAAYYQSATNPNYADFSCSVHNQYRLQGIARFMLNKIIDLALENGYEGLNGDVLMSNQPMIHILKTIKFKVEFTVEGESLGFKISFKKAA
jgi:acyl-CoA hydrolase/ribosomal protein S18 acetylase RimI-like enzyme